MNNKTPQELPWWAASESASLTPTKVRKYSVGSVFSSVAVVFVIVIIVGWTVWGADPARPSKSQFGGVEYPASVSAVINQCGNIFTFTPPAEYYGTFSSDEIEERLEPGATFEIPTHPMIVPVYGYMAEEPEDVFEQKMYTFGEAPSRSQLLRAMWDGAFVVWHSPSISNDDKARLSMSIRPYENVIAVEWAGSELPLGRKYAFSTWGVSQSCQSWDEGVFSEFLDFVSKHPEFSPDSTEPPEAILDEDGMLQPIDPIRW